MNFILSDGNARESLLPFTFTRPVAAVRVGILTISEKWETWLKASVSFLTEEYLQEKFPLHKTNENMVINGALLPNASLVKAIQKLKPGEVLVHNDIVLAYTVSDPTNDMDLSDHRQLTFEDDVILINNTWDIFSKNGEALLADFELLTAGRKSQPISDTNTIIGPDHIFVEEGAKVECSILNASTGPIYIGKYAEIMEGCIIRGPMALCNHAVMKMGAKIYGPSTFGPHCRVGGEVNNSVMFAYSNKGHEGFLGNSVLGEWCNLGADTNTSNLKNNYAPVRLWSYKTEGFAKTGLQFCGLMMGDHSKAGINTMFNTGTVVGVNANVFGSGYPRNFIPSYSWGGASGFTEFKTTKAFEVAKAMMQRRGVSFDDTEKALFQHVFELTKKWRKS